MLCLPEGCCTCHGSGVDWIGMRSLMWSLQCRCWHLHRDHCNIFPAFRSADKQSHCEICHGISAKYHSKLNRNCRALSLHYLWISHMEVSFLLWDSVANLKRHCFSSRSSWHFWYLNSFVSQDNLGKTFEWIWFPLLALYDLKFIDSRWCKIKAQCGHLSCTQFLEVGPQRNKFSTTFQPVWLRISLCCLWRAQCMLCNSLTIYANPKPMAFCSWSIDLIHRGELCAFNSHSPKASSWAQLTYLPTTADAAQTDIHGGGDLQLSPWLVLWSLAHHVRIRMWLKQEFDYR